MKIHISKQAEIYDHLHVLEFPFLLLSCKYFKSTCKKSQVSDGQQYGPSCLVLYIYHSLSLFPSLIGSISPHCHIPPSSKYNISIYTGSNY